MAKSKGKARMYYEDDDGNMIEIEAEGVPTISGPLMCFVDNSGNTHEINMEGRPEYEQASEEAKNLLKRLRPIIRIGKRHTAWSVPFRVLQSGTPFSYN